MLKLIKKGITIEKVKKAYKWANEAGIKYIEAAFKEKCFSSSWIIDWCHLQHPES